MIRAWVLFLTLFVSVLVVVDGFANLPRSPLTVTGRLDQRHFSSKLSVVGEKSGSTLIQEEEEEERFFFIRKCLPAEVGPAADILTEAFFKQGTNPITYQWERLTTYLSLEGLYPKPGTRHVIYVACHSKTGKVLGLAEIDDRPAPPTDQYATPRPYMFNVAVNPKWQRKGIARALVSSCEDVARAWGKPQVWLKVRSTSKAAIAMYESMGYVTRYQRVELLNKKYLDLIIMSKYIITGYEDDDEDYNDATSVQNGAAA